MAKRKHTGTVVIAILVAILLAVGVSGWLFWQSVQRVIGEAQQAGEYAAEAQQSVGQGDFKQALEQMGSAGSHIVTARDETQGMPWQAAEYVPYYGSDVKAVRGIESAHFTYDTAYMRSSNAVSLCPEMPLSPRNVPGRA